MNTFYRNGTGKKNYKLRHLKTISVEISAISGISAKQEHFSYRPQMSSDNIINLWDGGS